MIPAPRLAQSLEYYRGTNFYDPTIDIRFVECSCAPPRKEETKSSSKKRNVNPARHLEDYYLGALGVNSCDVSVNSYVSAYDITIGYSYQNYNSTVPSSPTNFVYSTNSCNAIVDIKSDSINLLTEINSLLQIFSSIYNSSPFNLQLNIDFNSSDNFQFISSHPFVAMQHDDEITIF